MDLKVGRTSKIKMEKSSNKQASINGKLRAARMDELAFKRFKGKIHNQFDEEDEVMDEEQEYQEELED